MAWFAFAPLTYRANEADEPPDDELSEDLHSLIDGEGDGDVIKSYRIQ